MPTFTRVQAGDLIRADTFNALLNDLEHLDVRVGLLEDSQGIPHSPPVTGPPVTTPAAPTAQIATITPASPRIGQEMTISGKDIGYLAGPRSVTFDGTAVTSFTGGSTPNLLVFDVPQISGFGTAAKTVQLTVGPPGMTVTRSITVQPPATSSQGSIDVELVHVEPARLEEAKEARFHYVVRSRAAASVSAILSAAAYTPGGAGGGPVWGWAVTTLDVYGGAVQQVSLQPGQSIDLVSHLTPAASRGGDTAVMLLQAVPSTGQGGGVSPAHEIAVGTDLPQPSSLFRLDPYDASDRTRLVGSTLFVARTTTVTVTIAARFAEPGAYEVTARPIGSGLSHGGVVLYSTDLPTPPTFVIGQDEIDLQPDRMATRMFSATLYGNFVASAQILQVTLQKGTAIHDLVLNVVVQ
jgi:hypothetical protein